MSKKTLCPNCGTYHYIIEEPDSATFEAAARRPFRVEAATLALPGPAQEIQPMGLPSMDTHVRIPLRQASISGWFDAPIGIAIGLAGGLCLAGLMDAASGDTLTPAAYGLASAGGGVIGGTIAFCWTARKEWPKRLKEYDALLWVEQVTGLDLNGDDQIGEPDNILRIELQDEQGRPRLIADLDTGPERFAELARLATLHDSFSESIARQAGYNRKEWEAIRDKFIELKAAAWKNEKNHKEGCYLREPGYRLFAKVLPPPLPGGSTPKNGSGTVERRRTNGARPK